MAQTKANLLKGLALAVAAFSSIPVMTSARAEPGERLSPRIRAGKPSLRASKQLKPSLRADKKAGNKKPGIRMTKPDQQKPAIRMNKATNKPGIRMKKSPQIRMQKAPGIRMTPGIRMRKLPNKPAR